MSGVRLEHVNITVRNPPATANLLVDLFGWRIRWEGAGINEGYTVHVGGDDSYLALYARESVDVSSSIAPDDASYSQLLGLNHIAVVVDDLEHTESLVVKAGFKPHSHADYVPGTRFYFHDNDGLEFEVVSYASTL